MDDERFDKILKGLLGDDAPTRRRLLRGLAAFVLSGLLAHVAPLSVAAERREPDGRAKDGSGAGRGGCVQLNQTCGNGKKCCGGLACKGGKCRCKGGTEPCGGTCCGAGQKCQGGACAAACEETPCGGACCDLGQICFNGQCINPQGTCNPTDDHCAIEESLCNGATDCFCIPGDGGTARCIFRFTTACGTCTSDDDCATQEPGTVCVRPTGGGCPCQPGQGLCASLCPKQ